MTHKHPTDRQDATEAAAPSVAAKKPYQPPQVRHERMFEISALICGKVQVTQASCTHNRSGS